MKKLKSLLLCFFIVSITQAQVQKKELSFDDILKWNRITEKQITHNGNYIVYKLEPWKGDAILKIADNKGVEIASFDCGEKALVTENSKFVAFRIKPYEHDVRELKLKKTKKDNLPKDKLGIYNLETKQLETDTNLISFNVPLKWNDWIIYQTNSLSDTTIKKKESKENGYQLKIKGLEDNSLKVYPFVTDYVLAKEKSAIAFVSSGDEKDFDAGVYVFDLSTKQLSKVLFGKGEYKQLIFNKAADKLAFVADTMDDNISSFELFVWTSEEILTKVFDNSKLNENLIISANGVISFSDDDSKLFFGIASKPLEKDTTVLDEEIPQLDIWHWNEPILHTEQLNTKKKDLKKSYLSVLNLNNNKFIQIEKESYNSITLIKNGNSNYAIAYSNLPYAVQRMWEGYPEHNDFYLIDITTGEEIQIKKDVRAYPSVSTEGNYIYWYNAMDTSWNTYNIQTGKEFKVTNWQILQCANEINDIPNPASAYGIAGWTIGDKELIVYDRYDIWKVNPENKHEAINLTKTGRLNRISYRIVDFENSIRRKLKEDLIGIDLTKEFTLLGHNEISREDYYYSFKAGNSKIKTLFGGKYRLTKPFKAKESSEIVFTKENFEKFPDLQLTSNNFKKVIQISTANPQQENFKWGTKELYTWTSLDGRKLQGLLAKPANFDPNKKYPLIVNFYEKASQQLYLHQIPEAHRSTVDYHYYTSNGYIVFNPDVYYKTGYPGEDAFNCVMPGITQLISEGFIDEKAIAAQGHSWGGYQVAYLATRTNLFAAIESGAPVVNMFSAYGGIRLWTGRNRSFQYEHTQSRIGKSIWEAPLRYIENSPLFTVDKIQTPILIMHNEDDGAVPFSQGVEFFIAMRRLGKKAWLLNYNDADHWPTKVRDKYDFQVRLAQFFDHYLKGKPMPKWMEEGIPAVNKGLEIAY